MRIITIVAIICGLAEIIRAVRSQNKCKLLSAKPVFEYLGVTEPPNYRQHADVCTRFSKTEDLEM